MSEVIDSIISHFKNRLKTPFYGILAFWWFILHWEFFYTLVFVSQETIYAKTGLLKNEYLVSQFENWHAWQWWLLQGMKLVIAAGLTYLMIWVVPHHVLVGAYDKQKKFELEKVRKKLRYERDVEDEKTKLEQQSVEKLKVVKDKVELQEQIEVIKTSDPKIGWEEEYKEFTKSELFSQMRRLVDALFVHNGNTVVYGGHGDSETFRLNKNMLAYAVASDLVMFDDDQEKITLTDKGKYFIKNYQNANQTINPSDEPIDLNDIPF